jgi:hypothetical protein
MFVIVIRSMCGTPSCEALLTVAVERCSVHGNGHYAVELLYLFDVNATQVRGKCMRPRRIQQPKTRSPDLVTE